MATSKGTNMNVREQQILDQIEASLKEDAHFAARIASGPSLPMSHKLMLAASTVFGVSLVMLFPANILLGLAGYLVLVAAVTTMLHSRPLKPAEISPIEVFHRITAGLLRNTASDETESALD